MATYESKYDYDTFAQKCVQGKRPACGALCPFNFDIRPFIEQMQKGNFNAAYKALRNAVVFPGIVSKICPAPCEQVCVRHTYDESISLNQLEKACVAFATNTKPSVFNLPKKPQKIAIIGGGLTGLTTALRLASKSYDVTIYEKTDSLGGRLSKLLPKDDYINEINLQLQGLKHLSIEYHSEITSLDALTFDAALIATGENGNDFGLKNDIDQNSYATKKEGVFLAGAIIDAEPVYDIAQAIIVAHSIEKYIKVKRMDGIPESFPERECHLSIDPSEREKHPSFLSDAEELTEEAAINEAKRCLMCDCTACKDACELFTHFSKSPPMMVAEAMTSLFSKSGITRQLSTRTMSSCNDCGLCKNVCPKEIDMGKFFHDFRYFKQEDNVYPAPYHEFFLRDMQFANHEAALTRLAPNQSHASHLFFPGCQLAASDPRYVVDSYRYLLSILPDTALMLHCCGAPADWGAEKELNEEVINTIRSTWESFEKPTFIFACPTCHLQLEKFLPEIPTISIYEVMEQYGYPKELKLPFENKTVSVFDPCSARDDEKTRNAIRSLTSASGATLSELKYSNKTAQCCGWGGNIEAANPGLKNKIVENRISESDLPYITYCSNCRDTFAAKGKAVAHALDLALGLVDRPSAPPPALGDRRKNRITAKNMLLEEIWNEPPMKLEKQHTVPLEISPELLEKLNASLVMVEEVEAVVTYCEETGNKVYDEETNHLFGYLQQGIITYWVEYIQKDDGTYKLISFYTHRVELLKDTV